MTLSGLSNVGSCCKVFPLMKWHSRSSTSPPPTPPQQDTSTHTKLQSLNTASGISSQGHDDQDLGNDTLTGIAFLGGPRRCTPMISADPPSGVDFSDCAPSNSAPDLFRGDRKVRTRYIYDPADLTWAGYITRTGETWTMTLYKWYDWDARRETGWVRSRTSPVQLKGVGSSPPDIAQQSVISSDIVSEAADEDTITPTIPTEGPSARVQRTVSRGALRTPETIRRRGPAASSEGLSEEPTEVEEARQDSETRNAFRRNFSKAFKDAHPDSWKTDFELDKTSIDAIWAELIVIDTKIRERRDRRPTDRIDAGSHRSGE